MRLKKYVKVDDATMRFETWEEHVLGEVFDIGFDKNENPPRHAPNGQPFDPKLVSPQPPVSAVEIKGEWLKIKWSNALQTSDSKPVFHAGWIRWKKNEMLLIELGYLC